MFLTTKPLRPQRPLRLSNILDDPRRTHAAANTHRYDSVLAIAPLQLTDDAGREPCARASQRMPQRNRPAIGIDLCRIEFSSLDDRQRLRRERFVQLDHVDVGNVEPSQLQDLWNRIDRANAHL